MHTSMCTNIIWCRYLTLVDLETEGLKCMPFCCITRALFSQVLKLEIYALTCVLYSCLSRGQKWLANSARKGSIRASKAKVEISRMQFLSPTCQSLFPVSIISPGTPLNGKVLLGTQRACLRARFRTGCEHYNHAPKTQALSACFECLPASRKIVRFQALFFDQLMFLYRHHPDVCTLRCAYSNRGCTRQRRRRRVVCGRSCARAGRRRRLRRRDRRRRVAGRIICRVQKHLQNT